MTRKRSLEEAREDDEGGVNSSQLDDDDDFVKDALRDQRAYQKEIEAEQKEREEARKANRTYVKGRKKLKKRESISEKQESFEKLRGQLKLGEREAKVIQAASAETLKKKRLQDKKAEDGEGSRHVSASESESDAGQVLIANGDGTDESDTEDEIVLLPGPSRIAKPTQTLPSLSPTKTNDYESEEELVLLSAAPKATPASCQSTNTAESISQSTNGAHTNFDRDLSSEDDIISLSVPSHLSNGRNIPAMASQKPSSREECKDIHGIQKIKTREFAPSTNATTLLPPDGSNRPCFAFTTEQQRIGPLVLNDGIEVPATINRFLRDYQREGVKFFYSNYKQNRGGLLGDDMGLGKTIQVIAFLAAIMKKTGRGSDEYRRINSLRSGRTGHTRRRAANEVWPTALIVCPASVMTNWQNELDTWGFFEHALLEDDAVTDFERGRLDILISSHQMAARKIETLKALHISVVFVDECHMLKNSNSNMTRSFNSLSCLRRFGLTGTAIQNRLEEFWTLLDWCNPTQFGNISQWQLLVAEPIRLGQSSSASVIQLAYARRIAEALYHSLLPPVFLRRTKSLIKAQLPNKRDNIVFCPLTDVQIASYKSILSEPECELIRRAKEPCDCGKEDDEALPFQRCNCCYQTDAQGRRWNYHMLKYIMLLQRCSNHLALVFPDPSENIEVTEESTLTDQMRKSRYLRQIEIVKQLFPDNWQSKQNNKLNGFRTEYCGKWLVLRNLMQEWKRQGDKVLLFSLNLRLLDWISYFVEMEGYKHLRLDGSTPQKKRQGLVNEFNRDPSIFVFLISTTAGGTGLNLTGANKVVIFDPHWNPAHDLQAMDRAYRFGQMRDVDVYRLIGKGSLEETIYDRQVYKQQLGRIGYDASEERRYFQPGDAKGFKRLFELHETGSVTKEFIKACDLTEATFAMQHLVEEAEVSKIKSEDGEVDLDRLLADTTDLTHPNGEQDDAIARILQRTGIDYTHINDKLFGGSKAEAAMTKRAKELTEPERPKVDKKPKLKQTPRQPRGSFPPPPDIPSWPPQRKSSRPR